MIGEGKPLEEILDAIVRLVGVHNPGVSALVMLYNAKENLLKLTNTPAFPKAYTTQILSGIQVRNC